MITAALLTDVYNRLLADTGSGGLFAGTPLVNGAYNVYAPSSTAASAYPYIIFNAETSENVDSFNTAVVDARFSVHTYVAEEDASGIAPWSRGKAIVARVRGDWDAQAGRTPSFGLDRWQPTLTGSGWSASIVVSDTEMEQHEEGVMHWVQSFRCLVSKAGV